eukprot:Ihof_evm2s800 gene=Ihof_evmTU2s800
MGTPTTIHSAAIFPLPYRGQLPYLGNDITTVECIEGKKEKEREGGQVLKRKTMDRDKEKEEEGGRNTSNDINDVVTKKLKTGKTTDAAVTGDKKKRKKKKEEIAVEEEKKQEKEEDMDRGKEERKKDKKSERKKEQGDLEEEKRKGKKIDTGKMKEKDIKKQKAKEKEKEKAKEKEKDTEREKENEKEKDNDSKNKQVALMDSEGEVKSVFLEKHNQEGEGEIVKGEIKIKKKNVKRIAVEEVSQGKVKRKRRSKKEMEREREKEQEKEKEKEREREREREEELEKEKEIEREKEEEREKEREVVKEREEETEIEKEKERERKKEREEEKALHMPPIKKRKTEGMIESVKQETTNNNSMLLTTTLRSLWDDMRSIRNSVIGLEGKMAEDKGKLDDIELGSDERLANDRREDHARLTQELLNEVYAIGSSLHNLHSTLNSMRHTAVRLVQTEINGTAISNQNEGCGSQGTKEDTLVCQPTNEIQPVGVDTSIEEDGSTMLHDSEGEGGGKGREGEVVQANLSVNNDIVVVNEEEEEVRERRVDKAHSEEEGTVDGSVTDRDVNGLNAIEKEEETEREMKRNREKRIEKEKEGERKKEQEKEKEIERERERERDKVQAREAGRTSEREDVAVTVENIEIEPTLTACSTTHPTIYPSTIIHTHNETREKEKEKEKEKEERKIKNTELRAVDIHSRLIGLMSHLQERKKKEGERKERTREHGVFVPPPPQPITGQTPTDIIDFPIYPSQAKQEIVEIHHKTPHYNGGNSIICDDHISPFTRDMDNRRGNKPTAVSRLTHQPTPICQFGDNTTNPSSQLDDNALVTTVKEEICSDLRAKPIETSIKNDFPPIIIKQEPIELPIDDALWMEPHPNTTELPLQPTSIIQSQEAEILTNLSAISPMLTAKEEFTDRSTITPIGTPGNNDTNPIIKPNHTNICDTTGDLSTASSQTAANPTLTSSVQSRANTNPIIPPVLPSLQHDIHPIIKPELVELPNHSSSLLPSYSHTTLTIDQSSVNVDTDTGAFELLVDESHACTSVKDVGEAATGEINNRKSIDEERRERRERRERERLARMVKEKEREKEREREREKLETQKREKEKRDREIRELLEDQIIERVIGWVEGREKEGEGEKEREREREEEGEKEKGRERVCDKEINKESGASSLETTPVKGVKGTPERMKGRPYPQGRFTPQYTVPLDTSASPTVMLLDGHDAGVVSTIRRGGFLFTACEDGRIRCYDVNTGAMIEAFDGHVGAVTCLCITPAHFAGGKEELDTLSIYSGGLDNTVRLFHHNCVTAVQTLTLKKPVVCLAANQ